MLFAEPIKFEFSGRTASNKFLKAPMTERVCTWDAENPLNRGIPTDVYKKLYEEWGRGEIGVIVSGNILLDSEHIEAAGNPILYEDVNRRKDEFAEMAKLSKAHGSLILGQLNLPGRQATTNFVSTPFSASDVQLIQKDFGSSGVSYGKPEPMSIEKIKDVVNRFADASEILYKAGFDGVQVHAAHGYLLR